MKKIPLRALFLAGLSLITSIAQAQTPVFYSEPLIPYFSKVPTPPASVAEAFKMSAYDASTYTITSPAYLTEFRSKLSSIQEDIQISSAMLSMNAGPSTDTQMKLAAQMQDPVFQKKIEAMSQQEKMEFAMKMQQEMAAGSAPVQAEDEDVAEVINEIAEITTNLNTKHGLLNFENSLNGKYSAYSQKIKEYNLKMQEWEMAEVAKLPNLPQKMGVSAGKDPQKVKNIKLASINKQIEFMDQQLKAFNIEWNKYLQAVRPQLTKADQRFAKIEYYKRVRNNAFKNTLLAHQGTLLSYVQTMAEISELIIKESAELQALKLKVEHAPLTEYEGNL
ncbi:hypothetical protein GXP67_14565 [Rhodocytophaga rosea]|uniref:TolC family protein n=1 Tax=Rhodocytophaga rosea TaxID=2704465 RepID=A0A6C0GJG3_9BACT|nr:hypothetical protein [Rhodocytophaga rosea]QHT67770.1 hypothetical protein GXP67_14565 [Rhodocytophaga rosea]